MMVVVAAATVARREKGKNRAGTAAGREREILYGRKFDLKSKTRISPADLINVAPRADVHVEIAL